MYKGIYPVLNYMLCGVIKQRRTLCNLHFLCVSFSVSLTGRTAFPLCDFFVCSTPNVLGQKLWLFPCSGWSPRPFGKEIPQRAFSALGLWYLVDGISFGISYSVQWANGRWAVRNVQSEAWQTWGKSESSWKINIGFCGTGSDSTRSQPEWNQH